MKLIIGLGTGRCGTVSLSKFLGVQEGFFAVHEGLFSFAPYDQSLLPWEISEEKYQEWKNKLINKSQNAEYVVDVASYFLPYVEKIMKDFPDVKFICLERPRSEVVKSFIGKTPARNHWMAHPKMLEFKDKVWDTIHPKFTARNKREALEMYWDMYHTTTKKLQFDYPAQFKVFSYTFLNSQEGKNEALDFIGFEGGRQLEGEYKHNASRGIITEFIKRTLWDIQQSFKFL